MPDSKITALTALTAADPAVDMLPIVDVSDTSMAASGTTKRISINNILACSPAATLASATISGDLTVKTSTLKVDSTNNRVGIGTASPASALDVYGETRVRSGNQLRVYRADNFIYSSIEDAGGGIGLSLNNVNGDGFLLKVASNNVYRVNDSYVQTWYDGANGTRMTLNSAGLGIGTASPATKLHVNTASGDSKIRITSGSNTLTFGWDDPNGFFYTSAGTAIQAWQTNGLTRMTLDASGNLGIGVTPSAWSNVYKAFQIGQSASVSAANGSELAVFGSNCYFDTTDSRWERITSGFTSQYYQTGGTHVWRIGGTAAANTDCSFTQSMTLDASGRLLVGKTVTSASTVGVELHSDGNVWATKSGSTSATTAWDTYSTGAGAYRFYVGMDGTVHATNTTISAISDARLKENVQDIDVGLGAILALKPRKFDWKDGKGKNIKGDRGFIAQEFEQVFPQLVDEWKDAAPEGEAPYKSVRQDLIPVLVKAIQELAAEVNALKNA
jgi:hypothetical protein